MAGEGGGAWGERVWGGCCYGSEQFMTLVLQNKQTLFYVEHWFSGSFRKIGKTKLTQQ